MVGTSRVCKVGTFLQCASLDCDTLPGLMAHRWIDCWKKLGKRKMHFSADSYFWGALDLHLNLSLLAYWHMWHIATEWYPATLCACSAREWDTITVAPIQMEMEDKYCSTWNTNTRKCETNTVGPVEMQEMQFRVVWTVAGGASLHLHLWPLHTTPCIIPAYNPP